MNRSGIPIFKLPLNNDGSKFLTRSRPKPVRFQNKSPKKQSLLNKKEEDELDKIIAELTQLSSKSQNEIDNFFESLAKEGNKSNTNINTKESSQSKAKTNVNTNDKSKVNESSQINKDQLNEKNLDKLRSSDKNGNKRKLDSEDTQLPDSLFDLASRQIKSTQEVSEQIVKQFADHANEWVKFGDNIFKTLEESSHKITPKAFDSNENKGLGFAPLSSLGDSLLYNKDDKKELEKVNKEKNDKLKLKSKLNANFEKQLADNFEETNHQVITTKYIFYREVNVKK